MTNQIGSKLIIDIADRLLGFIERGNISSVLDLEARLNERYDVESHSGEFITIEKNAGGRSSPIPNCWVYTIDYVVEGKGIPIELRVNANEGYSKVIVKFAGTVETYSTIIRDDYGNIIQAKNVESTDILHLKKELIALKRYLSRIPS